MALTKAALKAEFKTALEEGRALGEEGTDDAIAEKLANAVGNWLNGYQPNVVPVLTSPSGPVTGTITVTIQVS